MKTYLSVGALALAAGIAAGSALAAPAPTPDLGRDGRSGVNVGVVEVHARGDHGRHGHHGRSPARGEQRTERVEDRVNALKERLKITDAQQPQFEAVANALREQAKAFAARQAEFWQRQASGTAQQPLTAPERMAQRDQAMADRVEGQRKFTQAFTTLYGSLSPEQKKIADDMLTRRHHRR